MTTLADPRNCFRKPKLVEWDGKRYFLCERTACCISIGVSYVDDSGMHVGMFASAKLADDTKAKHEKLKDNAWQKVELVAETYVAPKKTKSEHSPKLPKPVYHAFVVKKSGKSAFDTEYIGKCTDVIAAISRIKDTTAQSPVDFKLRLTFSGTENSICVTGKSASSASLVVTDVPAAGAPYNLLESMEEAKKLKGAKKDKPASSKKRKRDEPEDESRQPATPPIDE